MATYLTVACVCERWGITRRQLQIFIRKGWLVPYYTDDGHSFGEVQLQSFEREYAREIEACARSARRLEDLRRARLQQLTLDL